MKEHMTNNRGNSLIELIMVMVLLVLFGVTIYTIIYAGSEAQRHIISDKDAEINARIALSYVNVKLRQNDMAGKISVQENPLTGQNAIVIRDYDEQGAPFDTWFFHADDGIYEFIGLEGELPDIDLSLPIIEMEGLGYAIAYDEGRRSITCTISYPYRDQMEALSTAIHLRSGGMEIVQTD